MRFRKAEHRFDEVLALAVKPCRADDEVMIGKVLHEVLAGKLCDAVHALRADRVKFRAGPLILAGEYIIR